jgi:hypothetical protein
MNGGPYRVCHTSWVTQEYWGAGNVTDVYEIGRKCLLAICIFRQPVKAKVENLVNPADFPDFTMYKHYFLTTTSNSMVSLPLKLIAKTDLGYVGSLLFIPADSSPC